MVTLTDVAAAAGVSIATVSHVMNQTRPVAVETVARVNKAIRETGYHRNPHARALRTATTESVGFVASDIANPFSTALMGGIAPALRKARYTLLVANADENPELERDVVDALARQRVDGLIVALTTEASQDDVEHIASLGIPVVLVDRAVSISVDQVLVENTEAVAAVIGEMLDLGHRRVAIVAGKEHHSTTVERVEGWRQAHQRRGLAVDEGLVVLGSVDPPAAAVATTALLGVADPPTAFFSTSNVISLGMLRALRAARLSVPEQVSFAAFDDVEWADLLGTPITCLAQPTSDLGATAVELLLRRLADPDVEHRTVRLPPELHVRESVGGPPDASR
ncbi:MAG: LacI family DNA-binding transcriptional regulator [Propionibacteriaceae bacterium]|nr:LacI family DNA-binding transcriptional regulator [Propionibacteriaceae bacterium]